MNTIFRDMTLAEQQLHWLASNACRVGLQPFLSYKRCQPRALVKSGLERRSQARFAVHCHVPLLSSNSSSEVTDCVTQNISNVGFYCLSRTAFSVGDSLSASEDALARFFGKTFYASCAVSVVRVEDAGKGSFCYSLVRLKTTRFARLPLDDKEESKIRTGQIYGRFQIDFILESLNAGL